MADGCFGPILLVKAVGAVSAPPACDSYWDSCFTAHPTDAGSRVYTLGREASRLDPVVPQQQPRAMLTANSRDDEKDPTLPLPYLRRYACPSLRRYACPSLRRYACPSLQPCFSRAPYTVVAIAGYRKYP